MNGPRVFISYSSRDSKIAAQLHDQLQSAGFEVWRDVSQIRGDWSREIAYALSASSALCLLWTEHAAQSKWVKHEWLTARALEKLIIPCFLPQAPPLPQPLSSLQGIHFEKGARGASKLVERLNTTATFTVRHDYTILPSNCYLPFNPNPDFTGRHADLLELYLKMIGNLNKIGINQVGAVGMGGIGKTQLAMEFAYRFSFAFDAVYWLQAAHTEQWLQEFVGLARDRLRLEIPHPRSPEANRQWLFALQAYLKSHPQTLIIMDNVVDPELLNSERPFFGMGVTPLTLGCNLLFTTRRHVDLPGVLAQPIDVLSPEAAYSLLTGHRPPETPEERKHAEAICRAVGYLPLALILVAGYLQSYRVVSYAQYQEVLTRRGLDAIDTGAMSPEELATRHQAAVAATLQEQWDALADDNARRLLQLAARLPQAAVIPKARLALLAGIGPGTSELELPLEHAFNQLHALSLLERLGGDDAVRLHPLVREFARRTIPEQDLPGFQVAAAVKLKAAYADLKRLENEYHARGIDQVIEDFRLAIRWSGAEPSIVPEMKLVERLLDRERHFLQPQVAALFRRIPLPEKRMWHRWHSTLKDLLESVGAFLGRERRVGVPDMQQEMPSPLFWQQVQHRATSMGLRELAQRWSESNRSKGAPRFDTREASEPEDPASIRTFHGHSNYVTAVDLSRDGGRALSGSWDGTLILWDVQSGQALRSFQGHSDVVSAVCLSADGRYALSGSWDGTLILWDVESGQALRSFQGHSDKVNVVSLSADGRRALSGSDDMTMVSWDTEITRALQVFKGHMSGVRSISLSPDGRRLLSGSGDARLILWDVETGQPLRDFTGHSAPVMAVSWSPDGRCALSADFKNRLILWDMEGDNVPRILNGHRDGAMAVGFSANRRYALSGSLNGILYLWDIASGQEVRTFRGHSAIVEAVSLSADGALALSGSRDNTLILWDVQSGQAFRRPQGASHEVHAVRLSGDGRRALSGSGDGSLLLWDVETGQPLRSFEGHTGAVYDVSFSTDARCALSASRDHTLILWEVETGRALRTLRGHDAEVRAVGLSADSRFALSGDEHGVLILWDVEVGQSLRTFKGHSLWVSAVSLRRDGRALSASGDHTLILWDVTRGRRLRTFKGHAGWVNDISFSADGQRVLSASYDHTLILWDVESGRALCTLKGHAGPVNAVSLSPDGRRALSGSVDHTLVLWDVEGGRALNRLFLKDAVSSVAVVGNHIVLGDRAGTVYFLRGVD